MAYHTKEITKGVVGEFSKVREEIEELLDAAEQNSTLLVLCELSDLIGAIDLFTRNKFNITLDDLRHFSEMTQAAFKEGKRK